jgi:site-specific DNA-methyltransferase (adenine-specific)
LKGKALGDIWDDIDRINPKAAERLGYPTQKPLALLERIIAASSNEGDVILDPFCGCGTAVDAAEQLRRRWIGIDITYLAVDLIRKRMRHTYGDEIEDTYTVHGIPADSEGAAALFAENPFDFERWAVSLIDAQPNEKQVGDKGIDGRVRFHADEKRIGQALVSVKGGKTVNPGMVRDLRGTVEREGAEMGILITLAEATRGMVEEARKSGTYAATLTGHDFPKIQILTVADLMAGKRPQMPTAILPYIKAQQTGRYAPGGVDQGALEV